MMNCRKKLTLRFFSFFSVLFLSFSLVSCSFKPEKYGIYKDYEVVYTNHNLDDNYHCETILNFKFCYEKRKFLILKQGANEISLKKGLIDLILTPDDIPSLFELFDSKHPRNYSKNYIELGTPFTLDSAYHRWEPRYFDIKDAENFTFYPYMWFSYHKFTEHELGVDLYPEAYIERSNYDFFITNIGGTDATFENLPNFADTSWCYYVINVEKLNSNARKSIFFSLVDMYFTYKIEINGPITVFYN